jgi:ParB-like chromosome segregation protein Spo0J
MRAPSLRMESVDAIHVCVGRRALREDAMPTLMESIQRIGLQSPIAVRIVDEIDIPGVGPVSNVPLLVAGRHRLEACRRLGMETVPVVDFDNERDARLWEISENLHRSELLPVERAEQIDEWRRLTVEKFCPQVVGKGSGRRDHERGHEKTADALGISHETVRRAEKIAALPGEIREQAREEGWSQKRLLEAASSKPVPPPPPIRNDAEAEDIWITAMRRLWNKGAKEWRERFLEEVST